MSLYRPNPGCGSFGSLDVQARSMSSLPGVNVTPGFFVASIDEINRNCKQRNRPAGGAPGPAQTVGPVRSVYGFYQRRFHPWLAQPDRAPDSGSGCCGFDSRTTVGTRKRFYHQPEGGGRPCDLPWRDVSAAFSPGQHRLGSVVRGYRCGSLGKLTDAARRQRTASPPAPAASLAAMLTDGRDSSNALRFDLWDRRTVPPPKGVLALRQLTR